MKAQVIAVN